MTSRRAFFAALAGAGPAAAVAPAEPPLRASHYNAPTCECGHPMMRIVPAGLVVVIWEQLPIKCGNTRCRRFDQLFKPPTMTLERIP